MSLLISDLMALKEERDQLRAENERLRRQCAEARQCLDVASKLCGALRNFSSNHDQWSLCTRLMMDIDDALANDAGKDFVPIAQHQELEKAARELFGAIDEQWSELCGIASELIGPDEDNNPECTCCGMSLEKVDRGHKGDCLANLVLGSQLHVFLRQARALGLLEKGGVK
jgi:hypothetical protein